MKRLFLPALLLCSLALCSATSNEEHSAVEREQVAERFVRQQLVLWQGRLQLQDWRISLLISHPSDLRPGTLGNIHWDAADRTARIRVLSVSDYKRPFEDALRDMQNTIVHELIHLRLSSITASEQNRSTESRTAEEDAVNRIAEAFLELDRATPANTRPATAPAPSAPVPH